MYFNLNALNTFLLFGALVSALPVGPGQNTPTNIARGSVVQSDNAIDHFPPPAIVNAAQELLEAAGAGAAPPTTFTNAFSGPFPRSTDEDANYEDEYFQTNLNYNDPQTSRAVVTFSDNAIDYMPQPPVRKLPQEHNFGAATPTTTSSAVSPRETMDIDQDEEFQTAASGPPVLDYEDVVKVPYYNPAKLNMVARREIVRECKDF